MHKERKYQEELDKAYKYAQQQLDIITAAIHGGIKISEDRKKTKEAGKNEHLTKPFEIGSMLHTIAKYR